MCGGSIPPESQKKCDIGFFKVKREESRVGERTNPPKYTSAHAKLEKRTKCACAPARHLGELCRNRQLFFRMVLGNTGCSGCICG